MLFLPIICPLHISLMLCLLFMCHKIFVLGKGSAWSERLVPLLQEHCFYMSFGAFMLLITERKQVQDSASGTRCCTGDTGQD